MPLKPSLRLLLEQHEPCCARQLGTFGRTLLQGMPRFENMDAFRGPAILSRTVERALGAQGGSPGRIWR